MEQVMFKKKYPKYIQITGGGYKGYHASILRVRNHLGRTILTVRVDLNGQTTEIEEHQYRAIDYGKVSEISEEQRSFEKFSPLLVPDEEELQEINDDYIVDPKRKSDYGEKAEKVEDHVEEDYRVAAFAKSSSPKGSRKASSFASQKRSFSTKLEANKYELFNNFNKMNAVSPGIIHDKLSKPVKDLMNILALDYDNTSINNHIVRLENIINSEALSTTSISDYKSFIAAYFFLHLNNLGVNIPIQPWMSPSLITANDNPNFIASALNKKGYSVNKELFDRYLELLQKAMNITILPAQKRIPLTYAPRQTILLKTRNRSQPLMRFPLIDIAPIRENVVRIIAIDVDKKINDIQLLPDNSSKVKSIIILTDYKENIGPSNKLVRFAKNNPGSLEAKLILPFHEKYLMLLKNAEDDFYEKPIQSAAKMSVNVEIEGIKKEVLEKEIRRLANGLGSTGFTSEEQSVLEYVIKNNQKIAEMNIKTIRNLKIDAITYEGIQKLRAQATVEFNKRINNLFMKNLNDYKINVNLIRPRPKI